MRELVPLITDDLDRVEQSRRTAATAEASVGFMGTWWNLDLTEEHFAELEQLLTRYRAAGELTAEPYNGRRRPGKPIGTKMSDYSRHRAWHLAVFGAEIPKKKDGQGYKYDPERVARWRAWEAEHGPYTEDKKEQARGGLGSDRH
jgi:hypothetical protein